MVKKTYFEATEFSNIKEILYDAVKKFPRKVAYLIKKDATKVNNTMKDKAQKGSSSVIDNANKYIQITYTKLLDAVNCLGTALFALGYKGKRIAIIGRNRYEWALAHFANLCGGIVSVPLDKDLQGDELEQSINRAKVDAVVFDSKYVDKIEELKNRNVDTVKEYICMDKLGGYTCVNDLIAKGAKLISKKNRDYIDFEVDSDAMNILLFTSGTSAQSKAVMLSQRNIASNVYAMQLVEPIFADSVTIAFLPFHHIFGSTCMIMMLACGVKTTFPDGIRYIAQNLREYGVSIFVGVPVLVEAIHKTIVKEIKKQGKEKVVAIGRKVSGILNKCKIDIRRKVFKDIISQLGGELRYIITGGAALDKEITEFFNSIGIRIIQGYGLTETAPVIAAEDYKIIRPGSVGRAMSNVQLEIREKDDNGIGEVVVKGPNVMLGYYEDEARTNEVIVDGWFHTGDLGYFDKSGYLFLTGRKKDMIVLKNGKKVFPEEIEAIINRFDFVEESFVFGLPKSDGDIKLSVKIVYNKEILEKEYPNKSFEEVKEIIWEKIKEVNKTFPTYKYIKNLILTDEELIKTTTKKVKRNEELKKILANSNSI